MLKFEGTTPDLVWSDKGIRDKALEAGFDDFLGKPFRAPALFALIEKHLDASLLARDEEVGRDENTAADGTLAVSNESVDIPRAILGELSGANRIRNLTVIKKIAQRLDQDHGNPDVAASICRQVISK